jgi:hypothetical protein
MLHRRMRDVRRDFVPSKWKSRGILSVQYRSKYT